MSKSHQEVGMAVKGTTLVQIHVMPLEETRPENLNYKLHVIGMNNQLSLNDEGEDLATPLGTGTMDGGKEERVKRFSRPEFLPVACITLGSPKTRSINPVELENSFEENDLFGNSEENSTFSNSPVGSVASLGLDSEMVSFSETNNVGTLSGTPEKLESEQGSCILFVKEETRLRSWMPLLDRNRQLNPMKKP